MARHKLRAAVGAGPGGFLKKKKAFQGTSVAASQRKTEVDIFRKKVFFSVQPVCDREDPVHDRQRGG